MSSFDRKYVSIDRRFDTLSEKLINPSNILESFNDKMFEPLRG